MRGCPPYLPYVLSALDDAVIKLLDWEKDWMCTQTIEGHSHYVMRVASDPQDPNAFASASLNETIKIQVWDDKGRSCVQTLQGHEQNVTAGSEDETLRIWDANGFGYALWEFVQ
ncbi:hypothetical protein EUGRSUZ_B00687 [Eucalyptus grandis]|uniref:Uncharacterized protein n=2 Tax=Eucalyptus grandis TaxID=71139 RepID=A0ACC3LNI9_EUCGR|nr:hypothetical protein EUGRSUZ_B00687 [Eucalyptus grandis]